MCSCGIMPDVVITEAEPRLSCMAEKMNYEVHSWYDAMWPLERGPVLLQALTNGGCLWGRMTPRRHLTSRPYESVGH